MAFVFESPEIPLEKIRDRMLTVAKIPKKLTGELSISVPITRRRLTSQQMIEGGVREATPDGWRFLLFVGELPVASVDVHRSDGVIEVEGCTQGPLLRRFQRGLEEAEKVASEADFTLSLLEALGLHFTAVWLSGEKDFLIPLFTVESLRAFHPVPLAKAEKVLLARAQQQQALITRRHLQLVTVAKGPQTG